MVIYVGFGCNCIGNEICFVFNDVFVFVFYNVFMFFLLFRDNSFCFILFFEREDVVLIVLEFWIFRILLEILLFFILVVGLGLFIKVFECDFVLIIVIL